MVPTTPGRDPDGVPAAGFSLPSPGCCRHLGSEPTLEINEGERERERDERYREKARIQHSIAHLMHLEFVVQETKTKCKNQQLKKKKPEEYME